MQKTVLSAISVALLIVGGLGFFSDPLFGVFEVDPLHNIIHLLTGVLGLLVISLDWDEMFMRVSGVVYGLIAVWGFWMGEMLGMTMNTADNVLHLVLALAFLVLGFCCAKGEALTA